MLFLSETDTVNQILDFALSQKDCRCVFVINPLSGELTGAISLSDFISHILYADLSSQSITAATNTTNIPEI